MAAAGATPVEASPRKGLPSDAVVLRQGWLRAYEFTTDRGAAALNDSARRADPFASLGKMQVSVEVSGSVSAR